MKMINAKTIKDKIDLFISIADEDGNGQLSFSEVHELSKISLEKFITASDENFLDDLSLYFTKFIFETCQTSIDKEIPITYIKDLIINVNYI